MNFTAMASDLLSGRNSLRRRVGEWGATVNRASFLAVLLQSGLFVRLATGQISFCEISQALACRPEMEDALSAWLQLGERLGVIARDANGYRLQPGAAAKLALPANDAIGAMAELIPTEQRLVLETPYRVSTGAKFAPGDHRPDLVARASRQLEPFVCVKLDRIVPRKGPFRVIDIGCGSAGYLRHMASRNPRLTGVGTEQDPVAGDLARANVEAWKLKDRIAIETSGWDSISQLATFDLAMLNLVIHYAPIPERTMLLKSVRAYLKPGGQVLLTNPVRKNDCGFEVLNLWGIMTDGRGPIPETGAIERHLEEAGFAGTVIEDLVPGMGFMCAVARNST